MYRIERALREDHKTGETLEVRSFVGIGKLIADLIPKKVKTKAGKEVSVIGDYSQCAVFDNWENGEKVSKFFQVEAWGKTAENLAIFGKKGSNITFFGRIETRVSRDEKKGVEYKNEILIVEKFSYIKK